MKRVYIISRYTAPTRKERLFNQEVARYFCRRIVECGHQPVAPHLFYTQFLNEDDQEERGCGLGFGLADLEQCDEFLLIVIDGYISHGMIGEIIQISRGYGPQRGRIVHLTRKEVRYLLRAVRR